jgi:hypothetical protein
MSDNNPRPAEPGPGDPGPADAAAPRDGTRLRLVTIVWTVLMAVAVVMIVLMLRS